jgi:hypothetical protein
MHFGPSVSARPFRPVRFGPSVSARPFRPVRFGPSVSDRPDVACFVATRLVYYEAARGGSRVSRAAGRRRQIVVPIERNPFGTSNPQSTPGSPRVKPCGRVSTLRESAYLAMPVVTDRGSFRAGAIVESSDKQDTRFYTGF